jgi:hypothetical protein
MSWHELRNILFFCPLCQTKSVKAKPHNSDERRDDYRLQCSVCGFHNPGWYYDHDRTIDDFKGWWDELVFALRISVKPCIFCTREADPWYSICSPCYLKNQMLERVLEVDKENKKIKRKLERS